MTVEDPAFFRDVAHKMKGTAAFGFCEELRLASIEVQTFCDEEAKAQTKSGASGSTGSRAAIGGEQRARCVARLFYAIENLEAFVEETF